MLKVGLIGTGYFSHYHLTSWSKMPNAAITALCDIDADRLKKRAQEFGVDDTKLYTDIDTMLGQADIDAVDIVSVPDSHYELVLKAARAGKHILCQKPFGGTFEKTTQMIEAVEKADVICAISEIWPFMDVYQHAKIVIDGKRLGDVKSVRLSVKCFYTPRLSDLNRMHQPFIRGLDRYLFFEFGPHMYAVLVYLFGVPNSVYARLSRQSPYMRGDDSGYAILAYPEFSVLLDLTFATRAAIMKLDTPMIEVVADERLVVDGVFRTLKTDGVGRNRDKPGMISVIDDNGHSEIVSNDVRIDTYGSNFRCLRNFTNAVLQQESPATSARSFLDTMRIMDAIYTSDKMNSVMSLQVDTSIPSV